MNKGIFKLGTRELDCVELTALNGIVQTLGTLYHCVHICSVSPNQTSFEKECSRGYKTVLSRSEGKDVDPVPITRPENYFTTLYAVGTGTLPEFLAWVYQKKGVIMLVSSEYRAQAQFTNTNSERR